MVQLANNIPGKFECINSYGPKDPTPIIEIGIPKVEYVQNIFLDTQVI